jgi:bacteriocin-like protein
MSQDKKPADKALEGKELDDKELEQVSGGPIYMVTNNQVSQLNQGELVPAVIPAPVTSTKTGG